MKDAETEDKRFARLGSNSRRLIQPSGRRDWKQTGLHEAYMRNG
jgi:hypothetical protein